MLTRIYFLKAADGYPRYVGKTIYSLDNRLARHIKEARREKHHRAYWINKCVSLGDKIEAVLIEEVEGDGSEREQFWISEYRRLGHDLVNSTNGGEGILGMVFTEESRAKMSASHKIVMSSPERRKTMSLSAKRRWDAKSDAEKAETIRRMSEASKKAAAERRARKPETPIVCPVPHEVIRKRISDRVRRWHASRSPEERSAVAKKGRATLAGKSDEDKARIRAAMIARRPADYSLKRSELAKKQWAGLTADERAEMCLKIGQGRLKGRKRVHDE